MYPYSLSSLLIRLDAYQLTSAATQTDRWGATWPFGETVLHALDCPRLASNSGRRYGTLTRLMIGNGLGESLTPCHACWGDIRPLRDELDVLNLLVTNLDAVRSACGDIEVALEHGWYRQINYSGPDRAQTYYDYAKPWRAHYALPSLASRVEWALSRACDQQPCPEVCQRWTSSATAVIERARVARAALGEAADIDDVGDVTGHVEVVLIQFDEDDGDSQSPDVLRALRHLNPLGWLQVDNANRAQPVYVLQPSPAESVGWRVTHLGPAPEGTDQVVLQCKVTQSLLDSTPSTLADLNQVWATAAGILA